MTVQITPTLLQAATGCPAEAAETFAPHLAAACAHYQIDTPERLVEFLAQLAHESGGLRYVREVADGSAYDGRADLGNIEPGDGRRFRGRGLIQVTGRSNYGRMSVLLAGRGAPDFTAEPEALETAEWAAWSAAAYWADASLNDLADAGMTVKIGRRINRGNANSQREANGEADRLRRREIAARAIVAAIDQIDAGSPIEPEPMPPQPDTHADAPGAAWPFPHANRPPRYAPAGEADPSPYIAPESAQEAQVGPFGATLIGGLANSVVTLMQPLLQDKLTRTLAKQTDPAIAAQVAANLIESAKRVTGKDDPIEAVAAVKATPRAVQAIEADVLADLERMAPILEKVAQWDRDSRADDEASRAAAAARAQADTFDAARPLLTWSFSLVVLCAVALVVVAVVQAAKTGKVDNEILLALVGFLTWAQSKAGTIVDYRFGTSRSSSAKDVVITELSRRKTGGQP